MSHRGPIIRASVNLATRQPRLVIAVWGFSFVLMAIASLGALQVLKAEDLVIAGTQSAREFNADKQAFGKSSPMLVLLEGPQKQLDRYGPKAAQAIENIDGTTVSSPWTAGAPAMLSEHPNQALLMLNIHEDVHDAGAKTVPRIRDSLSQTLPPGIHSHVAGEARFSSTVVDLALSGVEKAEIIAAPFLLLILLLIFRAPIAAALPLMQGIAVIVLTTGIVTLLGRVTSVNVLAQGAGSAIGLALGVDYSLLFVARFRDELAAGASIEESVGKSIDTAGRTVVFAGGILVIAGAVIIVMTFGWASLATGALGVVIATILSVLGALTLLPALLTLIGEDINRWPIGRRNATPWLAPFVYRMISKPAAAAIVVLIPLLYLSAHAFGLSTGGPDLKILNADNPVRKDVEAVSSIYGGGVLAPYEVLVKSKSGPITSPRNVRMLERFQLATAADPSVKYVVGLGTNRVRSASDAAESGPSKITKFDLALGAASTGVHDLRRGVGGASKGASTIASANGTAAGGAQQIAAGLGAAASGAGLLTSGLNASASGSKRLDGAMQQLDSGGRKIRSAMNEATHTIDGLAEGSRTLKNQLDAANQELSSAAQPSKDAASALADAKAAMNGLSSSAKSEPEYQSASQSIDAAQSDLSVQSSNSLENLIFKYNAISDAYALGLSQAKDAQNGAARLSSGINRLSSGITAVSQHTGALVSGLGQLSNGSGQLSNGLAPLHNGASALSSGLGKLGAGSSLLGAGLASGYTNSRPLESGVHKLHSSVSRLRRNSSGAVNLKAVSRSPYLTMALLSAASPEQKQNLRLVLNEQNGGGATRIFVITKKRPTDKSLPPFAARLNADSAVLAKSMGAQVAVGGPGRKYLDYDRFTQVRILPLILIASILSFLFLLVVFRSVLLPIKAVILNMITVGAAMGVIQLLYSGDSPVLGGPGWIEATSFFIIYSTTFALSMDYEIFMINRMRESYLEHGSNEQAIRDGVTKTAGIITGSAAVMTALFIAIALTAETVSNAQMGLGLAVAVAIDATVVRLILLPASMRLFGDANWWLPDWLDRILPRVAIT